MRKRLVVIVLMAVGIGMAQARTASAAPIIAIDDFGLNSSGQFFADFLIEDPIGLDVVDIFAASNVAISPLSFGENLFFGTIDDVIVRATVINASATADIGISVLNTLGAETRATFILDPVGGTVEEVATVPEPATLTLLASGLIGAAARRRCKPSKRKQ